MDGSTAALLAILFAVGVPGFILYCVYKVIAKGVRGVAHTTRRTHAAIRNQPYRRY